MPDSGRGRSGYILGCAPFNIWLQRKAGQIRNNILWELLSNQYVLSFASVSTRREAILALIVIPWACLGSEDVKAGAVPAPHPSSHHTHDDTQRHCCQVPTRLHKSLKPPFDLRDHNILQLIPPRIYVCGSPWRPLRKR